MRERIENQEFGGERPLFGARHIELENVTVHAGESAIKCAADVVARNCRFEGKYPFWHVDGFTLEGCEFTPGARAALWYSKNLRMTSCQVDAPKMFREMQGIELRGVRLPDAQETLWHCSDVDLEDVTFERADYLFLHGENIRCRRYRQWGNYSYQYCQNVVIRDSEIHSKDAFWNTRNVTVYDSTLDGEYLGWHSEHLRLVRCHISGTQPLCYTKNLRLEDCTFSPDCDLAFEDAVDVQADIRSRVTSIKNPASGIIRVPEVGEIILDEHQREPRACEILLGSYEL